MDLPYKAHVWNCAAQGCEKTTLGKGDIALRDLLLFHGQVMNGGILDALEAIEPEKINAAISGYEFFSLTNVLILISQARHFIDSKSEDEALEESIDHHYYEIIDDQVLDDAFSNHFELHPEDFAPLA